MEGTGYRISMCFKCHKMLGPMGIRGDHFMYGRVAWDGTSFLRAENTDQVWLPGKIQPHLSPPRRNLGGQDLRMWRSCRPVSSHRLLDTFGMDKIHQHMRNGDWLPMPWKGVQRIPISYLLWPLWSGGQGGIISCTKCWGNPSPWPNSNIVDPGWYCLKDWPPLPLAPDEKYIKLDELSCPGSAFIYIIRKRICRSSVR